MYCSSLWRDGKWSYTKSIERKEKRNWSKFQETIWSEYLNSENTSSEKQQLCINVRELCVDNRIGTWKRRATHRQDFIPKEGNILSKGAFPILSSQNVPLSAKSNFLFLIYSKLIQVISRNKIRPTTPVFDSNYHPTSNKCTWNIKVAFFSGFRLSPV